MELEISSNAFKVLFSVIFYDYWFIFIYIWADHSKECDREEDSSTNIFSLFHKRFFQILFSTKLRYGME